MFNVFINIRFNRQSDYHDFFIIRMQDRERVFHQENATPQASNSTSPHRKSVENFKN